MTQTNTEINAAPAPQASAEDPSAQTDPLLHLHKMSTTAGLGSQDYVAVSVTAVVAVLFGLASLLAVVSWVMLVIPIVGVVLSLIAIRQVNQSNGTLTGRGLAIFGLVLSGVITLGIFTYQTVQQIRRREDSKAIAALCEKYGQAIAARDYAAGYGLFDQQFKDRISPPQFSAQLELLQRSTVMPPIDAIEWNGLAQFNPGDNGVETAEAVMKVQYHGLGDQGARLGVRFRKNADGPWLIDNIPDQFQGSKKRPGG
jgi:hypothetical protein